MKSIVLNLLFNFHFDIYVSTFRKHKRHHHTIKGMLTRLNEKAYWKLRKVFIKHFLLNFSFFSPLPGREDFLDTCSKVYLKNINDAFC